MTPQDILTVLTRILRDLLLDESIVLTMGTRREDIPSWDSFNYINFIVAVEVEFNVTFRIADVESFDRHCGKSRPYERSIAGLIARQL